MVVLVNTEELKKLLKDYSCKEYGKTHDLKFGFDDAVDLLWPLVEALEKIKKSSCDLLAGDRCVACKAKKALSDLEQKLKGE